MLSNCPFPRGWSSKQTVALAFANGPASPSPASSCLQHPSVSYALPRWAATGSKPENCFACSHYSGKGPRIKQFETDLRLWTVFFFHRSVLNIVVILILLFMDMETSMYYSHFNKRRCYQCNAIQNHPGNFEAKRVSYPTCPWDQRKRRETVEMFIVATKD